MVTVEVRDGIFVITVVRTFTTDGTAMVVGMGTPLLFTKTWLGYVVGDGTAVTVENAEVVMEGTRTAVTVVEQGCPAGTVRVWKLVVESET